MDLENLFVSDLLNTLVGDTDDRSTTLAVGEEGDQPEPPGETPTEPEPTSTTLALGEEGDQPGYDTVVDGPVTSDAVGEEGDQPEDGWDTVVDGPVTSDAVGEEGDQPEDHWDTEIEPEPEVTTQALGEEGDQPEEHWDETETETDGSEAPSGQGIWAGEDGNGGGCVIDVDDTSEPEECEPTDEDEVDEDEAPSETNDPLNCW